MLDVHFDFRLSAESAQQNALQIALFGFAGGQNPAADLLRHKRVVAGELLQLPGTKKIDPAVAYVRDAELLAVQPGDGQS